MQCSMSLLIRLKFSLHGDETCVYVGRKKIHLSTLHSAFRSNSFPFSVGLALLNLTLEDQPRERPPSDRRMDATEGRRTNGRVRPLLKHKVACL